MSSVVKLREVVLSATGSRNPTKSPAENFVYVDVAAVDNGAKTITGARTVIGAEAPSRARKLIRSGDILVSTVRPNLNAVALVSSELDGQVASTGFCVLRASDKVLPEYLFYFTRSKPFVEGLSSLVAGALYPAVSDSQVLDQELPVPPLPEQRRIVDLLSRAEGIVRLRREAEKKAAELIPALFLDMFGDPGRSPKGWPSKPLDAVLAETKLGLVRGAKETADDKPFPYLRMDAVGGGYVRATGLKRVDATSTEIADYSLRYGDFLFNTRNSKELVGKTGMFIGASEPVVLFNNNLMRMRFDQQILVPEYVNALFQTKHMQNQLDSIKRGTTSVFAIYYKDLRHLQLTTPPLGMQADFARHVSLVQSIQVQNAMATLKAKATFDALLAQAFSN